MAKVTAVSAASKEAFVTSPKVPLKAAITVAETIIISQMVLMGDLLWVIGYWSFVLCHLLLEGIGCGE
jgi:hypothetical protein